MNRPGAFQGEVEYFDRHVIKGWAVDRNAPERAIRIEVMSAGRHVAEIAASDFRWDLRERFQTSGNHGFVFLIPPELLVSASGRFELRFAETGTPLVNSRVDIAPVAERLHAPFEVCSLTGRKALLLAPHPDDESLTCGGTLRLHILAADPVKVVFLTDGSRADTAGRLSRAAYTALRRREAEAACGILGVTDFEFWNYPDRELSTTDALDRLAHTLDAYRPGLIYAPSPLEFHPDHRAAAELAWQAVAKTRARADVAFYESNRPIHINRLVSVDSVQRTKEEACRAHRSQMENLPYAEILGALSRYRALTVAPAVQHAEGFFLLSGGEIAAHTMDWFTVRQHLPMANDCSADPLVSVVIRTRNRSSILREALSSLVIQTYSNIEAVVVNAGTENVSAVVAPFRRYFPVRVVSAEIPLNRAAAASLGIENASGKYVNFLDDDDLLYAPHIAKLAGFLETTGECVAYSDCERQFYRWENNGLAPAEEPVPFDGIDYDRDRLLFHNFLPMMTVLWKKSLVASAGTFDASLDVLEDWDFWIRLSKHADFFRVPGITTRYRTLIERPHGDLTEAVHRKHADAWVDSMGSVRERIATLQHENATLERDISARFRELGILRGRLGWQIIQAAKRALRRFGLAGTMDRDPDLPIPTRHPLPGWRKDLSAAFCVLEGLHAENAALRKQLAGTERQLQATRTAFLPRLINLLPQPVLEASHRAYRRLQRSRLADEVNQTVFEGDPIEVRPFRPGDEPRILALFRICFGRARSLEHWRWKFAAHPWGIRKIMVATTERGQIVAHYGGYPARLVDATAEDIRTITALQIGDTMTSPRVRHVGRRHSNLLHRISQDYFAQYCEGQVDLIFGFNTGKIQRYYLKLVPGMRFFEGVPFMSLTLDDAALARLRAAARQQASIKVRRVTKTDAAWDRFFNAHARHYGLLTQRDAAYVQWRYLDNPDPGYRLYAAYEKEELSGWSVFRQEGERLQWGDGMIAPGSQSVFPALLLHAIRRFRVRKARSVDGWFSRNPVWWREAVSALGFEPKPEPERIGMMYRCFLTPDLHDTFDQSLYYAKGDSDLF